MKKIIFLTFITFPLVFLSIELVAQKKIPTSLRVTVLDELGNLLPGSTVTLYNNQEDYTQSKNPISAAISNKKGLVNFKKLTAMSYFIDARKDDLSNDGAGAATDTLQEGRINKVNVVIR
jgi:hypothetical protein